MTKIAYLFPGQGSQSIGMMTNWGSHQETVTQVYQEASDALGFDLWKIVSEGPDTELNKTQITQPAMLCAGVATWRIVSQLKEFPAPVVMAGHSLGEYSALVCANSLSLSDAVKLVAKRGQLMQSAVAEGEGAMAALIGLCDEDVIAACKSVEQGVVEAVNFNAPGQVVIAGDKASVETAMEKAKEMGAKRALALPVSVPSHCSLMIEVADQLAIELDSISMKMPDVPVIHNQNAAVAGSVDEIKQLLKLQLFQPVKWVEVVQSMHQQGIQLLIESGPGKVLTGLTRRIDKSLKASAVFDIASFESTQQTLIGE